MIVKNFPVQFLLYLYFAFTSILLAINNKRGKLDMASSVKPVVILGQKFVEMISLP